ncbi:hypothetical protein PPL_09965 [Heterostelium album PN500]|uniref:Uncharacterized protein n=1 Tax=Heterostelium pallidum (strain ATCC 26659 / Pp 5 / PN500) TaxID=670386 RepID=D3BPS1_HETP5|nr:hypothetical protein PPL_09965 [Heterostelium album PN500]EFA76599.1 hypothetical protein PPL_09965 [Heterostelium album PN500]|eukprot:XP_020428731.1 hypothetical protein PPL_09965 [Heterostelium album PN500]
MNKNSNNNNNSNSNSEVGSRDPMIIDNVIDDITMEDNNNDGMIMNKNIDVTGLAQCVIQKTPAINIKSQYNNNEQFHFKLIDYRNTYSLTFKCSKLVDAYGTYKGLSREIVMSLVPINFFISARFIDSDEIWIDSRVFKYYSPAHYIVEIHLKHELGLNVSVVEIIFN